MVVTQAHDYFINLLSLFIVLFLLSQRANSVCQIKSHDASHLIAFSLGDQIKCAYGLRKQTHLFVSAKMPKHVSS